MREAETQFLLLYICDCGSCVKVPQECVAAREDLVIDIVRANRSSLLTVFWFKCSRDSCGVDSDSSST